MQKLLTIVIPTYNMQDYLHRCLDSLVLEDEQLMSQLEVLVINDGSKDNSSTIAHEYENKYPATFRVIDKENGNYGSCVNRGVKEAVGKYIKILDADDWFDTQNFEMFLHFLQNTDADLIISDFEKVKRTGIVIKTYHFSCPPGSSKLNDNKGLSDMWMHAVTYKRAVFDSLLYHQTEGISYTDQEWIFLPMTRVKRVDYFPHVVYKYWVERDGQSISDSVFAKSISQEIASWKAQQSSWEILEKDDMGDAEQYLWYRLTDRAKVIYRRNILGCFTGYSNQELKDFDNYIKDHNRKLYDELEYATYSNRKFRFVHYWRKWHHYRPLVCLLLKIENKLVYWGYKYGGMH